ncbi:MAG: PAS domain S-box protein [Rhizobiaceae bacterium]
MTTGAYSFIDIAVLEGVRNQFAAGDPLVLLSQDLETLLWVNGPGAALLGHDDIESALGTPLDLGIIARRQISAAPGFPDLGSGKPLMIRIHRGSSSIPVACIISSIRLPDGNTGILLAIGGTVPAGLDDKEIAKRAISGLHTTGHCAALIDADGGVVSAGNGFTDLEISRTELRGLISEVASEDDRLVKRMLPGSRGEMAAGIGRLADDPAQHLLIIVAEADEERGERQSPLGVQASSSSANDELKSREPAQIGENEASAKHRDDAKLPEERLDLPKEPTNAPEISIADNENRESSAAAESGSEASLTEAAAPSINTDPVPGSSGTSTAAQSGREAVRFVWRTDAEGRFSAISPEFAEAVGPEMADIVGRPFKEVAEALGMDKDGDIAGLLARRDTWSGRSVMWPVSGSGERVTVDLAALPAYSRDRVFEGFRGFGVVRLTETSKDEAAGSVSLSERQAGETEADSSPVPADETQEEQQSSRQPDVDDPFLGEKPAIRIVPTPDRRESDKIVRLASHRQYPAATGLSDDEETAFREIGERLSEEIPSETAPDDSAVEDDREAQEQRATEEGASETPNAEDDKRTDQTDKSEISPGDFIPSAFAAKASQVRRGGDVSVLEQLPVAVLIRSGDQLHYANPEFLRLTGYRSLHELDDAGGFDVLFAGPDNLTEDNDPQPRPAMRLVTRDGAEKLCEAHLRSVRWDDHRALMLTIRPSSLFSPPMDGSDPLGDDLNDRIQELTAILDTATDGVVLLTPSGAIRSLNHSAEALFGFESSELLGKQFKVLFAIESQNAAADYLSGLSGNGVASVLNDGREVIGREAQGRFIPLFMTMGKLPGDRGFCAVMRDITPWKRAEEELTQARGQAEQASSLKTDFLAKISHEVRTPLNAIIGFSELMLDEKFGPIGNTRYRDYLRDINSSGNHVLDLVNDLLDISKIEAGEQEMDFESVSLNDALADTVALMQPDANRERVIIRSSFASNLPEVVADLRSVKQIALNLLSNAIKFTPAGGQVIVSTVYQNDGNVILRVRDTGIGMSRLEIDQAMRPFKQIGPLKSRRSDGTGLGLPLTKAMVEANRAGFSIESTPDEGTIVEITFPSTRVLAD